MVYLPLLREVREAALLFERDVTPSPSKERGIKGVVFLATIGLGLLASQTFIVGM